MSFLVKLVQFAFLHMVVLKCLHIPPGHCIVIENNVLVVKKHTPINKGRIVEQSLVEGLPRLILDLL